MALKFDAVDQVEGLYKVIPMTPLRHTPGVSFDVFPGKLLQQVNAVDRVIHRGGAISPGSVDDVERPWYMHSCQDDNLLVLHGTRYVDIYTPAHGRMESFVVRPDHVEKGGELLYDGACLLVWPRGVFHRIRSCPVDGSASLNFATHHEGFSVKTNFNVFDLDIETGDHRVIREGHLDQPGGLHLEGY